MICPHCRVSFHPGAHAVPLQEDKEAHYALEQMICPSCRNLVLLLTQQMKETRGDIPAGYIIKTLIYPRASSRPPCPAEVPPAIAEDYREACLVLADSPKASASLSRRCLQHLLEDAAGAQHGKPLAAQIDDVISSGHVLSTIVEALDMVRHTGNFAAHPEKSQNTGAIVAVDPEEAELNLVVLEALFDFYYVLPAKLQEQKATLNAKLQSAGKPPIP